MPRALPLVVGAVVLANATIFLLSDAPLSAADVIRTDRGTTEKYAYLRASSELDHATILAAYDYLVAARYDDTAAHAVYGYDPTSAPFDAVFEARPCPASPQPITTRVLECNNAPVLAIWDDLVRVRGNGWETVTLRHGAKLRVARNMAGVRIRVDGLEVTLDR